MASDKPFLVRSSDYILGPYSKTEIENSIYNGTFSFNDEVIKSGQVGFAIQDHADFSEYANKISTQTRLTNFIMNVSGKLTVTQKTKKAEDTQTITIASSSQEEKTAQAEEMDFKLVEESKKPTPPFSSTSQYRSQIESQQIVRQKVSKVIRAFWQGIIFISVCVISYIFFQLVFVPYQQDKLLISNIQKEGMNFYKSGDYDRAFVLFKKGLDKNLLDVSQKRILINLFVLQDNLIQADSLLREIKDFVPKNEQSLIKGLIAFREKDYSSAENNLLAVQGDEKKQDAHLNLALLKWMTKNYKDSLKKVDQLIFSGYERGFIFYLKNLNLVKTESNRDLTQDNIETSLKNTPEYQQEIFLLQSYLQVDDKNIPNIENFIKKLLDLDPYFYKYYQYNPFAPTNIISNWSYLLPYCKKIFSLDKDNVYLSALYGFCHLKAHNYKIGSRHIEKSKNQNPEDELILSLFAYSLILEGSVSEAEAILDNIVNSKYKLPFILKAKLFEQNKQWSLALKQWNHLHKKNPYNLSAIAGLALNNYKLGNMEEAMIYKKMGLSRYSYHTLLLGLTKK